MVFAKWIYTEPRILILDEPTRGVDIGAKKEIYSIINQLAEKGVAIIMVSSELPEVLGMSDRIMVVREGMVRGIIGQDEADQEGDRDAAADTGGGVFRVLLSLTDVQIGGTAVTKAPGKCLSDNEDGEHHAGGGISQSTHLAVSDKDLIHDVIERADQKGEDAGDGELQHQFRDLLLSQIVCLLFRPHGLTSVYLVSWSLYQRKAA